MRDLLQNAQITATPGTPPDSMAELQPASKTTGRQYQHLSSLAQLPWSA